MPSRSMPCCGQMAAAEAAAAQGSSGTMFNSISTFTTARLLGVISVALVMAGPASAQVDSLTIPECAEATAFDADGDGISDACELALALTFAPHLRVRPGGCNWNSELDAPRLGGGYLFGVQAVDARVRLAYLPAYFMDCGWSGPKCWLPGVDCSPHAGDSEFIVVELSQDASARYSVSGVFLSAHCFGRSGDSCRWYRAAELRRFQWIGPSVLIWVAEGRNANYPSRSACDQGHYAIDTCDRNDADYVFPVLADRNIGSRIRPIGGNGCVAAPPPNAELVECLWAEGPFRGWQLGAAGVTGYARYLLEVAEF